MKFKTLVLSVGCVLCWIVLFQLVVIGGGIALFLIAVGTELSCLVTGSKGTSIDPTAAHEMAMRICFGYRTHARARSRFIR